MKKLFLSILISIMLGFVVLFFWPFFNFKAEETIVIPAKIIETIEREIITPSPLKAPEKTEDPSIFLNENKIIEWTNVQREKQGLNRLKENPKLNEMAKLKVEDMFKNQYFEHDSPEGIGVKNLAEDVNYQFLTVGENLAMGNFKSDKDLVEAWMASPGHRENILNANYQEIGVAIKKDFFEGKLVWMAVQHFGTHLTACPEPDKKLKEEIREKEIELEEIERELVFLKEEIKKIRPKWGSHYQEKIENYNDLVDYYNKLVLENKNIILKYNNEVREFNECIGALK